MGFENDVWMRMDCIEERDGAMDDGIAISMS